MPVPAAALTRFETPWRSLERCAGLLRASASRHDAELAQVTPLDMAAATIGAEAWMVALSAGSLSDPVQFGPAATSALARVLARAASGHGDHSLSADQERALVLQSERPNDMWFADIELWAEVVDDWGMRPTDVFARAAVDLCVGPPPVQAMALLLWDASIERS